MSTSHFCFYDKTTGLLHSKRVVTDHAGNAERFAAANAPPGHAWIVGVFDPLSQRVDVNTGEVVDYVPPVPSPEHEWNATTKRWQLNQAAAAKLAASSMARMRIGELEASQHRALREAALGDTQALTRLKVIDDQISTLRKDL